MTASRSRATLVVLSLVLVLLPSLAGDRQQAATPPGPYILTDLGTFGGLSAQASDINDAGQVVGAAASATSGGRPFIWQNGVMTDLGTLGGNTGGRRRSTISARSPRRPSTSASAMPRLQKDGTAPVR
jgi:probable HAF family extracellular repeat protein